MKSCEGTQHVKLQALSKKLNEIHDGQGIHSHLFKKVCIKLWHAAFALNMLPCLYGKLSVILLLLLLLQLLLVVVVVVVLLLLLLLLRISVITSASPVINFCFVNV